MITFDEISFFFLRAFFVNHSTNKQEKEWDAALRRLTEAVIACKDDKQKQEYLEKVVNALDFDWGGAIPDYTAAYKFFDVKEDDLDAEVLEALLQGILMAEERKKWE